MLIVQESLAERAVVEVSPTTTVIVAPAKALWRASHLLLELKSLESGQDVFAELQRATDRAGEFTTLPSGGTWILKPNDILYEVIEISGADWVRVIARASGIGLTLRVTAWLLRNS